MKELGKLRYWTPAGIVMDEPPPAYAAAMATTKWEDWNKHSYGLEERISNELRFIDVTIWRHQEDGHLFVDYCIGGGPIRFLGSRSNCVSQLHIVKQIGTSL